MGAAGTRFPSALLCPSPDFPAELPQGKTEARAPHASSYRSLANPGVIATFFSGVLRKPSVLKFGRVCVKLMSFLPLLSRRD